jgi:hypothetical protein
MIVQEHKGKEILCSYCGTKHYRVINKNPEIIPMHKRDCPLIKKLLKNSIEI